MIKVGSLDIPDRAGFDVNIAMTDISPRNILRTRNGTGLLFTRWSRLGIVISATGWIPEGLDSLNINQPVDIHLVNWMSTASASNVITIPRAFRTDSYAPQALAFVNDEMLSTSVSLLANVATLGAVAGATSYVVNYCPIISCLIEAIERDFNEASMTWSFVIKAQEQ